MLNMIKGCIVPLSDKLIESYEINQRNIIANVNADKIKKLMQEFINMHNELLFVILEVPTNYNDEKIKEGKVTKFHKDIYYLDGCNREQALYILDKFGDILINDGLIHFGFGSHESQNEIMLGDYNVISVFSDDKEKYAGMFDKYEIPKTERVLTAWDTFTYDNPGRRSTSDTKVYSTIDKLKEMGLYFAERREE